MVWEAVVGRSQLQREDLLCMRPLPRCAGVSACGEFNKVGSQMNFQAVREVVVKELEQAKPQLMREFGLAFVQVLREEGFAKKKEVGDELRHLQERLVEWESTKAAAREGLCRKVERLNCSLAELSDRVEAMEKDFENFGKDEFPGDGGEGEFFGMASDVEESFDDPLREALTGVWEGAYVRLKGVVSRPELNGTVGRLLEFLPERLRWAVQLQSDERILLKRANIERFNG